jgi:hypothetical protein
VSLGTKKEASFYVEPLLGYRTWEMTDDPPELHGCFHKALWPTPDEGRDARALCLATESESRGVPHKPSVVPVLGCQCGFYAYWTYEILQKRSSSCSPALVSLRGVVIGWGKAIRAENGWRAKRARPVALLHWPERRRKVQEAYGRDDLADAAHWNDVARAIAERYDVPYVEDPADLESAARYYLS